MRGEAVLVGRIAKVSRAPYAMLAFAAIGIVDALFVAHSNYTGQPLWCPIIGGCTTTRPNSTPCEKRLRGCGHSG